MSLTSTRRVPRDATGPSPLASLYAEHGPGALRLAYLLTGNGVGAEDLVQEAFIRVAGKVARIDEQTFGAYLRRTIVNLHTSSLRRRKVERKYLVREGPRLTTTAPAADVETRDEMWERLRALPARQRAALVLRYYEDLSEQQTADALGCSPGAAKALVTRGLSTLRDQMRGERT